MNWPRPLTGTNPLVGWLNSALASMRSCEIRPGVGYKIKKTPQGTALEIQATDSIARWQNPKKELDPTVAVSKGTWVYISPGNSLVTTGLTDLVSGVNVKALSGIWEAAQDVPAKVSSNYNVPQLPYPGATGTPSGSPLAGDLDGADVFWIAINVSGTGGCDSSGNWT